MIGEIVQNTPLWVWGVFVALLLQGLSQLRERQIGLLRATLLPMLLLALSLAGVLSAFGERSFALAAWAAGVAAALWSGRRWLAVRGASWSPHTRRLQVPGSALPLALMMGLFATKYGVGVSLALHPALAGDSGFAMCCSLAYGAFSGLFLARAAMLHRLAVRSRRLESA